jgi:hypothetical protein
VGEKGETGLEKALDNRTNGGNCLSYVVRQEVGGGSQLPTSHSRPIMSRGKVHMFIDETAELRRITLFPNTQGATNRSVGWRATATW